MFNGKPLRRGLPLNMINNIKSLKNVKRQVLKLKQCLL